jgi:hypothetical protein
VFPHLFNQWRGEALSRGEREIREEVSFQASEKLLKVTKKRATSLKAYRVEFIGPLTEYAGTENGRGEHKNAPIVNKIKG